MSLPNNCRGIKIPQAGPQSSSSESSAPCSSDSSDSQYESGSLSSPTSSNGSENRNREVGTVSKQGANQHMTEMKGEEDWKESSSQQSVSPLRNSTVERNKHVLSNSDTGEGKGLKGLKGVKKGMKGLKAIQVLRGMMAMKGIEGMKGIKGIHRVKDDSGRESGLYSKEVENMNEIGADRYSNERVPQAKRLSFAYHHEKTVPVIGSKARVPSENPNVMEKVSKRIVDKGTDITRNVVSRVPTIDSVDYVQKSKSHPIRKPRELAEKNTFRNIHMDSSGGAASLIINKINNRNQEPAQKEKDRPLSVRDAVKSSSETDSSDDPSPVRVSRMKRYDDFVSHTERIKFITCRIKQLQEERERMVIIREKWQRKTIRDDNKRRKQLKRTELKTSDFISQEQRRKGKEAINIASELEELEKGINQKHHPSALGQLHAEQNMESYDDIILIRNRPKLSRQNTVIDRPLKIDGPSSKHGPMYEPCRPLTMKGRTKEVRDANKAASFGLANLGGDEGKVVRIRGLPNVKSGKIRMTNYLRSRRLKMGNAQDSTVMSSEGQEETRREGRRNQEPLSGRKRVRPVLDDSSDEEEVVKPVTKKHRGRAREGS